MAIDIGRLGSIGLGIEGTAGTANTTPSVYLPFDEAPTLRGHHELLEIISASASRNRDRGSSVGKKWSEGTVKIDLDVVNSGYLFKVAMGNEMLATGTPNSHTFYTTVSGNTPKTATLIYSRSTDVEQYAYSAIDQLNLEFGQGLATLAASFKGAFPTTGATQTPTTTSGTVVSFKDASFKLGSTLTTAGAASATAINSFKLNILNNLEVIHRSGSADVSLIRTKDARVTGSYTIFFNDTTERDAYYNLSRRSMEVKFVGNANELIKIRIPQFRLSEGEVATGLDDFFVVNATFEAEDVVDTGTATRLVDVLLQNDKGTVYA